MAALKSENNTQIGGDNLGIAAGVTNEPITQNIFNIEVQTVYCDRQNAFYSALSPEIRDKVEKTKKPEDIIALLEAQRIYATSGNDELINILTSAVANHITSQNNNAKSVLRGAIEETKRLDKESINLLSMIFFIVFYRPKEGCLDGLNKYIINTLRFYSEKYVDERVVRRLLSTACCSILPEGSSWKTLEELLLQNSSGLLTNGFTREEAIARLEEKNVYELTKNGLIKPCLRNLNVLQFNAIDEKCLEHSMKEKNIEPDTISKIKELYKRTLMDESQVKNVVSQMHPDYIKLSTLWKEDHGIKSLNLTSIGIAIAIINIRNQIDNINIKIDDYI